MRRVSAIALLAAAGWLLSGCGGSTNKNPTFGGATQPPPQPTTTAASGY